jgi:hypothetical protein
VEERVKISSVVQAEFEINPGSAEIEKWLESLARKHLATSSSPVPDDAVAKVSWQPTAHGLHCDIRFTLVGVVDTTCVSAGTGSASPSPSKPVEPAAPVVAFQAWEWAKKLEISETSFFRQVQLGTFKAVEGRKPAVYEQIGKYEKQAYDYKALSGGEILVQILRDRKPVSSAMAVTLGEKVEKGCQNKIRSALPRMVYLGFIRDFSGSFALDTDKFSPLSGRAPAKEITAAIDLMKESPFQALSPAELLDLGFTKAKIDAALDAGWFRNTVGQRIGYWRLGGDK